MSDNITYYERKAYTFMDLLGDFGGFNDAIIFILSTIFAGYSSRMFEASIATTLSNSTSKKFNSSYYAKVDAFRTKLIRSESQSLDQNDL